MKYYPVNLNIRNRKILLIGGGKVALRKLKRLLKCGSKVKIVSPKLTKEFEEFIESRDYFDFKNDLNEFKYSVNLQYFKRRFKKEDLNDVFLVIAAADNQKINERIARIANKKDIMVNVVNDKEISDFNLPVVINRGDFLLSFTTSSQLPALSKSLREKFEDEFGNEYALFIDIMRDLYLENMEKLEGREKLNKLFNNLVDGELIEKISDVEKEINKEIAITDITD